MFSGGKSFWNQPPLLGQSKFARQSMVVWKNKFNCPKRKFPSLMLKLKKYTGAKIVSYCIIILSVMILAGLPIMFLFAKSQNIELPKIGMGLVFSVCLAVFGVVSATRYLKKKKWSRISLMVCCILYFATYIHGFISAFMFNGSISWSSIVAIIICLYGVWYLINSESKEWLVS